MKAENTGKTIVLTMSLREARELEAELLWCRDEDKWSKKAWEALNALHENP